MNKAEFIAEHGSEWTKFSKRPIFASLLSLIDDESPARNLHTRPDNDRLHGATVFANEIAGHERLRSLLVNLANPEPKEADIPTTFTDEEKVS